MNPFSLISTDQKPLFDTESLHFGGPKRGVSIVLRDILDYWSSPVDLLLVNPNPHPEGMRFPFTRHREVPSQGLPEYWPTVLLVKTTIFSPKHPIGGWNLTFFTNQSNIQLVGETSNAGSTNIHFSWCHPFFLLVEPAFFTEPQARRGCEDPPEPPAVPRLPRPQSAHRQARKQDVAPVAGLKGFKGLQIWDKYDISIWK